MGIYPQLKKNQKQLTLQGNGESSTLKSKTHQSVSQAMCDSLVPGTAHYHCPTIISGNKLCCSWKYSWHYVTTTERINDQNQNTTWCTVKMLNAPDFQNNEKYYFWSGWLTFIIEYLKTIYVTSHLYHHHYTCIFMVSLCGLWLLNLLYLLKWWFLWLKVKPNKEEWCHILSILTFWPLNLWHTAYCKTYCIFEIS